MDILARILQVQISQKSTSVCLDLLGSTLVKGIVNKKSTMKIWPLIFVYQATEAIYLNVMHNYDTQTILLQYTDDINFRGKLTRIVSDKDPVSWSWSKVEQKTEDELVPLTMNQLSTERDPTQKPRKGSDAKKNAYLKVSDICRLKYAEGSQVLTMDKMEVEALRSCLSLPVSWQNFEERAWLNQLLLKRKSTQRPHYNDKGEPTTLSGARKFHHLDVLAPPL